MGKKRKAISKKKELVRETDLIKNVTSRRISINCGVLMKGVSYKTVLRGADFSDEVRSRAENHLSKILHHARSSDSSSFEVGSPQDLFSERLKKKDDEKSYKLLKRKKLKLGHNNPSLKTKERNLRTKIHNTVNHNSFDMDNSASLETKSSPIVQLKPEFASINAMSIFQGIERSLRSSTQSKEDSYNEVVNELTKCLKARLAVTPKFADLSFSPQRSLQETETPGDFSQNHLLEFNCDPDTTSVPNLNPFSALRRYERKCLPHTSHFSIKAMHNNNCPNSSALLLETTHRNIEEKLLPNERDKNFNPFEFLKTHENLGSVTLESPRNSSQNQLLEFNGDADMTIVPILSPYAALKRYERKCHAHPSHCSTKIINNDNCLSNSAFLFEKTHRNIGEPKPKLLASEKDKDLNPSEVFKTRGRNFGSIVTNDNINFGVYSHTSCHNEIEIHSQQESVLATPHAKRERKCQQDIPYNIFETNEGHNNYKSDFIPINRNIKNEVEIPMNFDYPFNNINDPNTQNILHQIPNSSTLKSPVLDTLQPVKSDHIPFSQLVKPPSPDVYSLDRRIPYCSPLLRDKERTIYDLQDQRGIFSYENNAVNPSQILKSKNIQSNCFGIRNEPYLYNYRNELHTSRLYPAYRLPPLLNSKNCDGYNFHQEDNGQFTSNFC